MDEEVIAVAAPGCAALARAEDILTQPLLQLESRTGDWGRWLAHHGNPACARPECCSTSSPP
jgi:LysR family glycine cleavage system transcriptional activator